MSQPHDRNQAITARWKGKAAPVRIAALLCITLLGLCEACKQGTPVEEQQVLQVYLVATPSSGEVPLTVHFEATPSLLTLGAKYDWDFDGDGTWDVAGEDPSQQTHTYLGKGRFEATVRLTNGNGDVDESTVVITVVDPSACPSSGGTVVLFDDAFPDADWETIEEILDPGASHAEMQVSTGEGHPDPFREATLGFSRDADGEQLSLALVHIHRGPGGSAFYDPSTEGAVASISFSYDHRILAATANSGGAVGEYFVLAQRDSVTAVESYYLLAVELTFSSLAWLTEVQDCVVADDFVKFLGDGPPRPDFSAAGGPMFFGLRDSNGFQAGGPGSMSITYGLDNWVVRVHQQ